MQAEKLLNILNNSDKSLSEYASRRQPSYSILTVVYYTVIY